jgi:molecular chaperone GrpE
MPSSPGDDGMDGSDDQAEPRAQESHARERSAATAVADTQADRDAASERERLATELAGMEDRYKRAVADLDNYRKRSERDVDRRVTAAADEMLLAWLQGLDSVERALRIPMEPGDPVLDGLRGVLQQMEAVLRRYGVERMGEVGEPFDHERHEAVRVEPRDDVPDRTIVEVARSGFSRGGRVLRPAQVVVSRTAEREG